MKKIFAAVFALFLVGAGCAGLGQAEIEGKWNLTFSLPPSWVMVKTYEVKSSRSPDTNVSRNDSAVFLQSTDKKVCTLVADKCPEDSVKIADGNALVLVTKVDIHRSLPDNLESLGNDFYRLKLCDDGGDCTANGAGNYEYYLKVEGGVYSFTYFGDTDTCVRLIESAKVVTKLIDTPAVTSSTQVKTE